jgi:hypothetical protein
MACVYATGDRHPNFNVDWGRGSGAFASGLWSLYLFQIP